MVGTSNMPKVCQRHPGAVVTKLEFLPVGACLSKIQTFDIFVFECLCLLSICAIWMLPRGHEHFLYITVFLYTFILVFKNHFYIFSYVLTCIFSERLYMLLIICICLYIFFVLWSACVPPFFLFSASEV